MSMASQLLDRAYKLIDANQLENAELVLDAVVRTEPTNVNAWLCYLQIHRNIDDLRWLKERVLDIAELSDNRKLAILDYHDFLVHRLDNPEIDEGTSVGSGNILPPLPTIKMENENFINAGISDYTTTQPVFELLDVFSSPIIHPNRVEEQKPDTNLEEPLVTSIHRTAILFVLFLIPIHLIINDVAFGKILLGLYFVGAMIWLINYTPNNGINLSQMKVYSFDGKYDLKIVESSETKEIKIQELDENPENAGTSADAIQEQ